MAAAATALGLLYDTGSDLVTVQPLLGPPPALTSRSYPAIPDVPQAWEGVDIEGIRELAQVPHVPGVPPQLPIPVELVKPGTCFFVTAVDRAGNESGPSGAVCLEAPPPPPPPPVYSGPCGSCHSA